MFFLRFPTLILEKQFYDHFIEFLFLKKYEFLEDIFLGCRLYFAIGIVQEFGELEGEPELTLLYVPLSGFPIL